MYNKDAKVRVDNIGLDNLWRLRVFIDGPYGTPSYSIFDSEHAVLVGAGIGVTPFASILQSIMKQYKRKLAKCPNCHVNLGKHFCSTEKLQVKKVDFIWVTRDQRSLEWFITMLSQMEIEQRKVMIQSEKETGVPAKMFMESHLYVGVN
jgi:predicted ferric reductase